MVEVEKCVVCSGGILHKFYAIHFFAVNDCTGMHFESSRIALTGNEKSISIAARARSDSQFCTQGQRSQMKFPSSFRAEVTLPQ